MADCFVNRSISKLKDADPSGVNIIGIKISGAKYIFNPDPELTLSRGDQLFVIGSAEQIKVFRHSLETNVD